jgi:hypothetical protein
MLAYLVKRNRKLLELALPLTNRIYELPYTKHVLAK